MSIKNSRLSSVLVIAGFVALLIWWSNQARLSDEPLGSIYSGVMVCVSVVLLLIVAGEFVQKFVSKNVIGHTVWCYWHEGVYHTHIMQPYSKDQPQRCLHPTQPGKNDRIQGRVLELAIGGWFKKSQMVNHPYGSSFRGPEIKVVSINLAGSIVVRLTDLHGLAIQTRNDQLLEWVNHYGIYLNDALDQANLNYKLRGVLESSVLSATKQLIDLVAKATDIKENVAKSKHAGSVRQMAEIALDALTEGLEKRRKIDRCIDKYSELITQRVAQRAAVKKRTRGKVVN